MTRNLDPEWQTMIHPRPFILSRVSDFSIPVFIPSAARAFHSGGFPNRILPRKPAVAAEGIPYRLMNRTVNCTAVLLSPFSDIESSLVSGIPADLSPRSIFIAVAGKQRSAKSTLHLSCPLQLGLCSSKSCSVYSMLSPKVVIVEQHYKKLLNAPPLMSVLLLVCL